MPGASTAFYGLRSNAHQLIAGAGVNAVRRRIKLDALLHDVVALEAGMYLLQAGGGGGSEIYMVQSPEPVRWQRPAQRRPTGNYHIGIRSDSNPDSPMQVVQQGPVQIRWTATFMPFEAELPREFQWLRFVVVDDDPNSGSAIRDMARQDASDPVLTARWPDERVREYVAGGTATDLVRVADLGLVLCSDPFHGALLERRVARGEARAVLGRHTLELLHPGELSWEEVDELRLLPGLRDFRSIIREIEGEALADARSMEDFDNRIWRNYSGALARAASRQPSMRRRVGVAALGLIVGEGIGAITGDPLVGVGLAEVVRDAADTVAEGVSTPRWLAVDRKLR